MNKTIVNNNNIYIPMPVMLVGSNVKGRANFMAAGWVTRVNSEPPMMMVSISKSHHTVEGIKENNTFSINFSGIDMVKAVDYCGLVSGKDADKSRIFNVFYGKTKTAPMIEEFSLCLECKLFKMVDV